MAITYRKPKTAYTLTRGVNNYKIISGDITLGRNEAITWSANIDNYAWNQDIRFDLDSPFVYNITIDPNTWQSPALLAGKRSKSMGSTKSLAFSGTDRTSYLASENDVTMESQTDKYSDYLLGLLATRLGITISNAPHYKVQEFDFQGRKGIDYISELLLGAGYNYHIGSNGEIVCLPINYQTSLMFQLRSLQKTEDFDILGRITKFRLLKTSKFKTQYCYEYDTRGFKSVTFDTPFKCTSISWTDKSIWGTIDNVAFWCGGTSGVCVGYYSTRDEYEPPGIVHGYGPIDTATFYCFPPSYAPTYDVPGYNGWKICFQGLPETDVSSEDYDLAFNYEYDSGWTPARPDKNPFESQIMPTLAHAQAVAPSILQEINKDTWTLKLDTVLNPWIPLGSCFEYETFLARVERVKHSFPPPRTEVDCMILES